MLSRSKQFYVMPGVIMIASVLMALHIADKVFAAVIVIALILFFRSTFTVLKKNANHVPIVYSILIVIYFAVYMYMDHKPKALYTFDHEGLKIELYSDSTTVIAEKMSYEFQHDEKLSSQKVESHSIKGNEVTFIFADKSEKTFKLKVLK